MLLALGPKGLEFGRYSIDYHYSRNWLYVQARSCAANGRCSAQAGIYLITFYFRARLLACKGAKHPWCSESAGVARPIKPVYFIQIPF